MPRIRHTSWGLFGICLTRALRLSAVAGLFAAWAFAATGPAPNFYARREYGGLRGCGQTVNRVADVNADGIPDILCSDGQILLGDGKGGFSTSPNTFTRGGNFMVLDLNGDGVPDILGLNTIDQWGFTVSFGNANGTFQTPLFYAISDSNSESLQIGDFNGDGIPDAATLGDQGIWIMIGKGGGVFNNPVLAVPGVGDPFTGFRAADMNGDGKLDLVVSAASGVAILFGNGNGTFQPLVAYGGSYKGCGINVADINSDGYLDVLCTTSLNTQVVVIYLGEAGGKLRAPYLFTIPNGGDVEVGDVNGDGIPDLVSDAVNIAYGLGKGRFSKVVSFPTEGGANQVVLANLRSPKLIDLVTNATFVGITVLLNKGNGTYVEGITTPFPSGLGCGTELDFNNDGIADLGYIQNGNTFLVMLGTSKIAEPFTTGPTTAFPAPPVGGSVCFTNPGDVNGDGIPDILIYETTSSGGTLYPLFGTGDGHFTVGPSSSGGGSYYELVDIDADGKADLVNVYANEYQYGNGDGTFQAPIQLVSGSLPSAITNMTWADLNADGKPDCVVSIEAGNESYVLLSNSSGTFTQSTISDFPADSLAVTIGDLNGDGAPDVVLGSALYTMVIYMNDGKGNLTLRQELEPSGLVEAFAPVIIDLNGDGMPEIAVNDGSDIAVFTNEGHFTFEQPLYFGELPGGLFFGNWHGQAASAGKPDIMMPNGSGSTVMLLNETK